MPIDVSRMNSAIRNHFADWWAAAAPVDGLDEMPVARPEGGTEALHAGEFSVEVLPVWDRGQNEGTDDSPRFRGLGLIQVNVLGPRTGLGTIEQLCARVAQWAAVAKKGQIPGLRVRTASPSLPLAAPAGMVAKHVDVDVLWLENA